MLRLKPPQRAVLVDKVPDMANIITAAIVIGFLLGERRVSGGLLVVVIGTWAAVLVFSLIIAENGP